jgi:RHS repeat-associated protein
MNTKKITEELIPAESRFLAWRRQELYPAWSQSEPAESDFIAAQTVTTDYVSNKIYKNGQLSMLLTEEGYIEKSGSTYTHHYYLKDHLGNHRVVMNASGTVVQATNYYPSGATIAERQTDQGIQPYKFGGKELDRKDNLNFYDYEARAYDPTLMRFTSTDPMMEKYYGWSPFAYCGNNPVNRIDPDGRIDIDVRTQQLYPQLAEYLKNLIQEWNNKSDGFKNAFKETSGLNDEQVTKMLTFGEGPKLVVKDLDTSTSKTNGETYLSNNGKGGVNNQNGGKGHIALDNDVVGMMENAQTGLDTDIGHVIVESTTFHELTHVGNAKTSHTTDGIFTESGKEFETRAYGQDIRRSNVAAYVVSTRPRPIASASISINVPKLPTPSILH